MGTDEGAPGARPEAKRVRSRKAGRHRGEGRRSATSRRGCNALSPTHARSPARARARLVQPLVLVAAVAEGAHGVDVEGVFPLADARGALLGHGLVQHALVHPLAVLLQPLRQQLGAVVLWLLFFG